MRLSVRILLPYTFMYMINYINLNIKAQNANSPLTSSRTTRHEDNKITNWGHKIPTQENTGKNTANKATPADALMFKKKLQSKSPETKGIEQHATEQTLRTERDKLRVDELVRQSNRSIITVSSVFPWNIFPNTIDVEEHRVTFIFRQFLTSQSHSVDIKDISNVFIESGLFFATLQVVSRTFVQNDIKINYLRIEKAKRVKQVIEGLRTFNHNNIDTSNYKVEDLIQKLSELNVSR